MLSEKAVDVLNPEQKPVRQYKHSPDHPYNGWSGQEIFICIFPALLEDVAVVAIHSDLVPDDVEAYLANYDHQLPFALDETGGVIQSFGGSTMLPQTVVIDEDGRVVYNAVGSVTYEKLEELLDQAGE